MKKIIILLCCSMFFVFSFKESVLALEVLPYWYSDSSKLMKFDSSYILYSKTIESGCDMSSSTFNYAVYQGENGWDAELELDLYASTGDRDIDYYCVSRSTAITMGVSYYAIGITLINYNTTATGTYYKPQGGIARFYTINESEVYLIWDDSSGIWTAKTSDYSSANWRTISMHETGHAIGYIGHTTMGSNELMYPYYTEDEDFSEPTYYDILQMNLLYPLE